MTTPDSPTNSLHEILSKRVRNLTKVLGLILVLGLVSLLRAFDTDVLNLDVRILNQISDINNEFKKKTIEKDDNEIYANLEEWLAQAKPDLSSASIAAENSLRSCYSSFRPSSSDYEVRATFRPLSIHGMENSRDFITYKEKSSTVRQMIEKFGYVTSENRASVLREIDPQYCSRFDPWRRDVFMSAFGTIDPRSSRIERLTLGDGIAETTLSAEPRKQKRSRFFFSADASVEELAGVPSYVELLDLDYDILLEATVDSAAAIQRVGVVYGSLPFREALRVASDSFLDVHQNIKLFGLEFSTRRYPLVVLIVSLATILGILHAIRTAAGTGTSLFADVGSGDHLIDPLTRNDLFRTLIWSAVPLTAIAISVPRFVYGTAEFYSLVLGALLVGGLGLYASQRMRETPVSAPKPVDGDFSAGHSISYKSGPKDFWNLFPALESFGGGRLLVQEGRDLPDVEENEDASGSCKTIIVDSGQAS